uniref:Uncharacterized protein n=1 Tax=Vespula pensylvanica TaxID=30213 RepID=A0A834PA99_VESPE|nr:hypothetical protein H0235_002459 [Vespula pensylvanica]
MRERKKTKEKQTPEALYEPSLQEVDRDFRSEVPLVQYDNYHPAEFDFNLQVETWETILSVEIFELRPKYVCSFETSGAEYQVTDNNDKANFTEPLKMMHKLYAMIAPERNTTARLSAERNAVIGGMLGDGKGGTSNEWGANRG